MQPRENEEVNVGPVSKQLRICVACGNPHIEEYEFGISCELCGTSFYFGRVKSKDKNGTNV